MRLTKTLSRIHWSSNESEEAISEAKGAGPCWRRQRAEEAVSGLGQRELQLRVWDEGAVKTEGVVKKFKI